MAHLCTDAFLIVAMLNLLFSADRSRPHPESIKILFDVGFSCADVHSVDHKT